MSNKPRLRRIRSYGFEAKTVGSSPRAGTTSLQSPTTVHPRAREEHQPQPRDLVDMAGSSPHARGTRRKRGARPLGERFITARGEQARYSTLILASIGSSPRARGTPGKQCRASEPQRFIPASAGNTGTRIPKSSPSPVHPRTRGEHSSSGNVTSYSIGSSPHAREHPAWPENPGPQNGSSPQRGEHLMGVSLSNMGSGSSPHARGTPKHEAPRVPGHRFIPARAGNPITPGTSPSRCSV